MRWTVNERTYAKRPAGNIRILPRLLCVVALPAPAGMNHAHAQVGEEA